MAVDLYSKLSLDNNALADRVYVGEGFQRIRYTTCQKFFKYYYETDHPVQEAWAQTFANAFGEMQIHRFSQYSPKAKDAFEIKGAGQLRIKGVLGANLIHVIFPKADPNLLRRFEQLLATCMSTTDC